MSLKCGIVGLPNVGKSTLFNALTKAGIAAENYPFCTIAPNVGIGYRVLLTDRMALHIDVRDYVTDKNLLGVEAFWLCWNNQDQIFEELKSKSILFDGDVLRDPSGRWPDSR